MIVFSLKNIPNQSFSTTQDGNRYVIRLFQCNGIMCCDIEINGVQVIVGMRVVSGTLLVPYQYIQNGNGNFLFSCTDENSIDYTLFGISQTLLYATLSELQSLALSYVPDFVANFINVPGFPDFIDASV